MGRWKEENVPAGCPTCIYASRSGLQHFQEQFSPHKTYIIGTGGLPWETLLRMDVREVF